MFTIQKGNNQGNTTSHNQGYIQTFKCFLKGVVWFFIVYVLITVYLRKYFLCSYTYLHPKYKNLLEFETPGNYKIFNPSICKYKEGFVLCCRYTNRVVTDPVLLILSTPCYKSHVCFMVLDSKFNIIQTIFPGIKVKRKLEDPRMIFYNNKFYVSIVENYYGFGYIVLPAMYVFDENFKHLYTLRYNWKQYFKIRYPEAGNSEKDPMKTLPVMQKNWCPFVYQNKMYIHTDTYPQWNVFLLEERNKRLDMIPVCSFSSVNFFKELNHRLIRCSTSFVSFTENTFLVGLHTKKLSISVPIFRSVLVEVDKKTMLPIRKTKVLCFDKGASHFSEGEAKIQFLSGLETDKDRVILSFGIGDYKTVVKTVNKADVDRMLN
jgi:hypothetical protein